MDRHHGAQDPHNKGNTAIRSTLKDFATYGNLVVTTNKLASETRQRLAAKPPEEPSENDLIKEEMAVAAMGAKHTETQLLRANRFVLLTVDDTLTLVFASEKAVRSFGVP